MSEALKIVGNRRQDSPPLQRCAEVFDALEETLLEEQQALLDRDPEVLLVVAERKRGLLVELQRIAASLVELPDAAPALRERLEATFARCRQLNQINGGVVAASRGATEKALALLRGDQVSVSLYDSHGDTRATGGSRSLAQA
ncbi:MAG TPA: flagellar protein FlgN [Gammaproteobacteria bacterium]|nr:flagellar protein FlgN [Gammaproteobacteria bacterium]HRP87293.1 flagellar protein FlgN [Gammaproteobacteria bacterium]